MSRKFNKLKFSLENEHMNNCGQFRVVRDISIAPLDMKVSQDWLNCFHALQSAATIAPLDMKVSQDWLNSFYAFQSAACIARLDMKVSQEWSNSLSRPPIRSHHCLVSTQWRWARIGWTVSYALQSAATIALLDMKGSQDWLNSFFRSPIRSHQYFFFSTNFSRQPIRSS